MVKGLLEWHSFLFLRKNNKRKKRRIKYVVQFGRGQNLAG